MILVLLIFASGAAGQQKVPATRLLRTSAHTVLKAPTQYNPPRAREKVYQAPEFRLRLFAVRFAQGRVVYAEITPKTSSKKARARSFRLFYGRRTAPLSVRPWGARGLFAIPPWERPGQKTITVRFRRGKKSGVRRFRLKIETYPFPTYRRGMDLGRYSNKTYLKRNPRFYAMIKADRRKKSRAFRRVSPDQLKARLAHPRDQHKITSPFYSKRITRRYYLRKGKKIYKRPWVSRHSGVDLYGRVGASIFALGDGVVVIAQKMYYEGNFVLIDHGARVFSAYMHQSKILVREGQKVRAGDVIGLVGATGMVTGPHLHLSLYLQGVKADALSLLPLPLR